MDFDENYLIMPITNAIKRYGQVRLGQVGLG
jgi:hypothetical protein